MLTFTGLTSAQREEATQLVTSMLGTGGLEVDIAISRSPAGVWTVVVRRPPGDEPSLLPQVARETAYADLAEILTVALSRALN